MFARFTPSARRAVIRAGILALDAQRPLGTEALLRALAEIRPFSVEPRDTHEAHDAGSGFESFEARGATESFGAFTLTPEQVPLDTGRRRDLLATLGIDLDELHRRTRAGLDDPARWRLVRSRLLRVTLIGPLGQVPLTMHLRKTVEVAMWKPGAVTGERLLWGLLADHRNGVARILCDAGIDLPAVIRQAGIPVRRAA